MARVRVKICGIANLADAKAAVDLGADALGFNFYEKSVRNIAPADAYKIIRALPEKIEAVGVFVNWSPEAVIALARAVDLDTVQLHGDEPASTARAAAKFFNVTKALRVGKDFRLASLRPFQSSVRAFLFDACTKNQFGGTGHRTDWTIARRAAKSHRIILAGGLTPENVAEAILYVRPYAVDVASGVESAPGKKDRAKLRQFFAEVSRANRQL
ncbi:MAG TPA: phosphoribosylanthranilate isomerase [Candidatus Eremiobacteraceae bacterium]|jgi:phosphoribosylanthranilate isomerase|nr:phosphoribosylanthranilate isomerase [Candidatus Eremiobacteraceae bacterium]